jgi:acetyl-CoA synthetase (ADP-forming)
LSKNIDEAAAVAREIGFPVVAKVVSPDIVHKSDAGCVKIDLNNEGEVKSAYSAVMTAARKYNKEASIQGVLISEMKPEGTEVIIGATRDPEFGPVVTFGLGGVFVEVLEDVAFRVAPLTQSEAHDMVHEIKGLPILKGIRGKEPADIEAIINVIMEVSRLMLEHPEIEELDLNPILVYPKGGVAVDARIIVTKSQ